MRRTVAFLSLLMIFSASLPASTGFSSADRKWHFTVYLDNKEIGYHRFNVTRQSGELRVISEARFDVKIWFINAYEYRHFNHEIWQDNCLVMVDAATDDNGELSRVQAQQRNGQLDFSLPGDKSLEGCVRSFAYWSPALLETDRLLNTQTGEHQLVEVKHVGSDSITVREQILDAIRYRIRTDKFVIDLWYSNDGHWLALDSTTEHGATLRYRIQ